MDTRTLSFRSPGWGDYVTAHSVHQGKFQMEQIFTGDKPTKQTHENQTNMLEESTAFLYIISEWGSPFCKHDPKRKTP